MLSQFGFNKLMHREDYMLDMKAVTHDCLLLGLNLKTDEEYLGVGG